MSSLRRRPPNGVASHHTNSRLYTLLHMESDKQDWSFVDKVVLCRDEVLCFFQDLQNDPVTSGKVPSTTATEIIKLDPSLLEGSEFYCVGFFGNKTLLQRVIHHLQINIDSETKSKMDKGPGIYACTQGSKLYLFYWHHEEAEAEASTGSICCNFVRYLVELCNIVYVCVANTDVTDFLGSPSLPGRQQRYKITFRTQPAEDDVSVRKGFRESFEHQPSSSFLLCGGLHSFALLMGQVKPSNTIYRRQDEQRNMALDKLQEFMKTSMSKYSLDFSVLEDVEFVLFLGCNRDLQEQWMDAWQQLRSLKKTHEAERQKLSSADSELQLRKKQAGLLKIFTRTLEDYLLLMCPWEENLFRDHEPVEQAVAVHPTSEDEVFEILEGEVCKYFNTGTSISGSGPNRLLFYGSVISLVCEDQNEILCLTRTGLDLESHAAFQSDPEVSTLFIIEGANKGLGPVQYSERVTLRPITSQGGSNQLYTVKFFPSDENIRGGLVLAGLPVSINQFPGRRFTIDGNATSHASRMKLWLQSCLDISPLKLQRKAEFASSMLDSPGSFGCTIEDPAVFVNNVFNGVFGSPTGLQRVMVIKPSVVAVFSQRYKGAREGFLGRIKDMVHKEIGHALRGSVEFEMNQATELFQQTCNKKETELLDKLKSTLCNNVSGSSSRQTLQLQRCFLQSHETQLDILGLFDRPWDSQRLISIKYNYPVMNRDTISWSSLELRTRKVDLERLAFKADHVVVPQLYSYQQPCMELDKEVEVLSKAFLLENQQVLAFVICYEENKKYVEIRMYKGLGSHFATERKCLLNLKYGFDLLCFNEGKRFVACYDQDDGIIRVAYFDEQFRRLQMDPKEIDVGKAMGKNIWLRPLNVIFMEFVPGKLANNEIAEIVLADAERNVWVLELSIDGKCKDRKHFKLPFPIYPDATCLTPDGSCLLVLANQTTEHGSSNIVVHVYLLGGERVSAIKSIALADMEVGKLEGVRVQTVMFGSQLQLIVHDSSDPGTVLSAVITVPQTSGLRRQDTGVIRENERGRRYSPLAYVALTFEKFAVTSALVHRKKLVEFTFLHLGLSEDIDRSIEHVEQQVGRLENSMGKNFSDWTISYSSCDLDHFLLCGVDTHDSCAVDMSKWIQGLVCLVPIQIARAERNGLTSCSDGLRQVSVESESANVLALVKTTRFGLYDDLIETWKGGVKVVSSMGKQSSGKSYLLNHLFGSLFDVATVRCTDGIWLSSRQGDDGCLYILLDFEGLDSPERSAQEDTLLSLLSAAVSSITIYNKKDFNFDKEMERILHRLQNAVALVQDDQQLFKGMLCIVLKDVPANNADMICSDFMNKIVDCCERNGTSFLSKLYGCGLEILPMEPFEKPSFFASIGDVAEVLRSLMPSYKDGANFLRDLKLFIAQVSTKDWGPIDSKRKALRLGILRKHLKQAVNVGCANNGVLTNLDTMEEIEDDSVEVDFSGTRLVFTLEDTRLKLVSTSEDFTGVLPPLRDAFRNQVDRDDFDVDTWFSAFERFLACLVARRSGRVLKWLEVNTREFTGDSDIQKLRMEAGAMLVNIEHGLILCGAKCERCFLKCIMRKSHAASHSCQGNHKCLQKCTYCGADGAAGTDIRGCSDVAGHTGFHDCNTKQHECSHACVFDARTLGCNSKCAAKPGHKGEHRCNSVRHLCREPCSLTSCMNSCSFSMEGCSPQEIQEHKHACDERRCLESCVVSGCNYKCSLDHFHSMQPDADHLCGKEHPCPELCEVPGNCDVETEVTIVRDDSTFHGLRSEFQYETVSQQYGVRKKCSIMIPAFQRFHEGSHCHSSNLSVVHLCDAKCGACGYFCRLPMGHPGLHDTTHGNMREMSFVAEKEDIDVMDRKYTWGESGMAELCSMYCRKQGRGHIHLIPCGQTNGICAAQLFDGARHETKRYGPNFDVPKDELTHAAYFEQMGFKDPYNAREQQYFAGCNHYCRSSEDHGNDSSFSGEFDSQLFHVYANGRRSYCRLRQWHERADMSPDPTGYVSADGHYFTCQHELVYPNHLIFVIDRSRSMAKQDIRPEFIPFARHHNNRLGCVFEALLKFLSNREEEAEDTTSYAVQDYVSVILFSLKIKLLDAYAHLNKGFYRKLKSLLLSQHPETGTNFENAVKGVQRLINKSDARMMRESTTVIFLSDGQSEEGGDPVEAVRQLKENVPTMFFHTVSFGTSSAELLRKMAEAGGGVHRSSLSLVQLEDNFQDIQESSRDQYYSLIPSSSNPVNRSM